MFLRNQGSGELVERLKVMIAPGAKAIEAGERFQVGLIQGSLERREGFRFRKGIGAGLQQRVGGPLEEPEEGLKQMSGQGMGKTKTAGRFGAEKPRREVRGRNRLVQGGPEKSQQGAVAGEGAVFERAVKTRARLNSQGSAQLGGVLTVLQPDERVSAGIDIGAVELRPVKPQQLVLPQAGGAGAPAEFPGNGVHLVNEADGFARGAIGSRILVTAQAGAQVLGLADVQDTLVLAGHDIDAGRAGNGAKEILPQPLEQRFRGGKQMELPCRHRHNLDG